MPDLSHVNWTVVSAVFGIVANVVGVVVIFWKLAASMGSLRAEVTSLAQWLHDVKEGKSPFCAAHAEAIKDLKHRVSRLERSVDFDDEEDPEAS